MDRINGANTIDIGGGRRGWRKQNAAAGISGTEFDPAWFNAIQEELLAVIAAAGMAPDANTWTQLRDAIRTLVPASRIHFGIDTGPVNAMVAQVSPAITGYVDGDLFLVTPKYTNTTSPTADFGYGAKSIHRADGTVLLPGEIIANAKTLIGYDAGQGGFVLLSGISRAYVDNALANLSAGGRLIRAPRVLLSGTSYTTPAGCASIYVEAQGAGGGGNINTYGGCGGGGGGMAARWFSITPATAYAYTIGAGGSAGAGGGAAGGDTTFTAAGVTITGGGGLGGGGGGQGSALTWAGGGGNGGIATGGDVNVPGSAGAFAHADITEGILGGSGFFGGARWASPAGQGYGAGGQGGTSAVTGTSGGQGIIRIWEYS